MKNSSVKKKRLYKQQRVQFKRKLKLIANHLKTFKDLVDIIKIICKIFYN